MSYYTGSDLKVIHGCSASSYYTKVQKEGEAWRTGLYGCLGLTFETDVCFEVRFGIESVWQGVSQWDGGGM